MSKFNVRFVVCTSSGSVRRRGRRRHHHGLVRRSLRQQAAEPASRSARPEQATLWPCSRGETRRSGKLSLLERRCHSRGGHHDCLSDEERLAEQLERPVRSSGKGCLPADVAVSLGDGSTDHGMRVDLRVN